MERLLAKIKKMFKFLYVRYKFVEIEKVYDKRHFGNAKVVLASNKIKFIFSRDRDFDSVGVSPAIDPKEEYDLHLVKAYIMDDAIRGEYLRKCSLDNLAKFLNKNYEKVEEIFSKGEYAKTKKNLEKLENIRYQKLLK